MMTSLRLVSTHGACPAGWKLVKQNDGGLFHYSRSICGGTRCVQPSSSSSPCSSPS